MEDARWDQMKDILLIPGYNRMAGIVAALVTDYTIDTAGKYVDKFAFALITPLSTYNNCVHRRLKLKFQIPKFK
jgi:hypothetical protein